MKYIYRIKHREYKKTKIINTQGKARESGLVCYQNVSVVNVDTNVQMQLVLQWGYMHGVTGSTIYIYTYNLHGRKLYTVIYNFRTYFKGKERNYYKVCVGNIV